eukprot:7341338-Pyramimonas_sp.AAC.1
MRVARGRHTLRSYQGEDVEIAHLVRYVLGPAPKRRQWVKDPKEQWQRPHGPASADPRRLKGSRHRRAAARLLA